MASTPSASALSAVLRCQGNIWTRNPPTKRPATSVCSLGLAGGVVRDSPAERTRSNRESAWEAFLQGERVVVGRRLTVAYKSPRVDGKVQGEKDSREMNKLCHPKLSQSSRRAHAAAPGSQNAPVRRLVRGLTSNLPGPHSRSQMTRMIKYGTHAAHICKIRCAQESSGSPAGAFKVSVTSPCLRESAGQTPPVASTGWSTLKSTCLSLTALVSDFVCLKLAVLRASSRSPDGAPQHLLSQQDEKHTKDDALQADGQIHRAADLTSTMDDSGSGRRITEDRPD